MMKNSEVRFRISAPKILRKVYSGLWGLYLEITFFMDQILKRRSDFYATKGNINFNDDHTKLRSHRFNNIRPYIFRTRFILTK